VPLTRHNQLKMSAMGKHVQGVRPRMMCAEEILARAEFFNNADRSGRMRRIAAGYEKLAERLDKEAGRPLG
jgi:hypothetical protein